MQLTVNSIVVHGHDENNDLWRIAANYNEESDVLETVWSKPDFSKKIEFFTHPTVVGREVDPYTEVDISNLGCVSPPGAIQMLFSKETSLLCGLRFYGITSEVFPLLPTGTLLEYLYMLDKFPTFKNVSTITHVGSLEDMLSHTRPSSFLYQNTPIGALHLKRKKVPTTV